MFALGRRQCNSIAVVAALATAAIGTTGSAADSDPGQATRRALLEAAGEQYAVYAELLDLMTDGGEVRLFDKRLDLGERDPQRAAENYRRISELVSRLASQREATVALLDELSRQITTGPAVGAHPRRSTYHLCSLAISDVFVSGWKFLRWPSEAQRRARVDVLGVAFADPAKHSSSESQMASMRKRIYEQARLRFGDRTDLGDSEIQFYRNLRDGKLDDIAGELHGTMLQDASNFGIDYMGISEAQGKRPIDIVYREACQGVERGLALNVAASTLVVQGGMPGGKRFVEGFNKAKDAIDKVKELEEGYKQFEADVKRATSDPTGLIRDKVKDGIVKGITDRAKGFVQEKLNLDDNEADLVSEHIGQSLEEFDHYIEYDEKIRDAYKIDDLSKREKRLREIYKAGRKGDWGAVAVNLVGSSPKTPSPSTLTVWERDGRLKVTYCPDPASTAGEIPVPAGAKVVVGAVGDDGRIRAISDKPLSVEPGKTTEVVCTPEKLRRIVDYVPSRLRRIRDESLDGETGGVDWGEPRVKNDMPPTAGNKPHSPEPGSSVVEKPGSSDQPGNLLDRYRRDGEDVVDWGTPGSDHEPRTVAGGHRPGADVPPGITELPETPDALSDVYRPNGRLRIDYQYSPRTVDADDLAERLQNHRGGDSGPEYFQTDEFLGLKVKPYHKITEAEVERYFESGYRKRPWITGGMYRIAKQGTARVWYDENQNGEQDAGEGFREEPYWIWYPVYVRASFHGWKLSRERPALCHQALLYVDRVRADKLEGGYNIRNRSERIHIRGTDEAYGVHQTSTTSGINYRRYFVAAVCGPFDLGAHVDVHCQVGPYTFHVGNDHKEMLKYWAFVEQADELQKEMAFYATGREDVAREILEAMADAAKGYIDYSRRRFLFTVEDEFELPGFSWPHGETDYDWLRTEMHRVSRNVTTVQNGGGTYKRIETYEYGIRCSEAHVTMRKWDDVLEKVTGMVDEEPSSTETSIQVSVPGADRVVAVRNKPKSWTPRNHGHQGVPFYTIQERIEFCIDNVWVGVSGYGSHITEPRIKTQELARELARRIQAVKGKI